MAFVEHLLGESTQQLGLAVLLIYLLLSLNWRRIAVSMLTWLQQVSIPPELWTRQQAAEQIDSVFDRAERSIFPTELVATMHVAHVLVGQLFSTVRMLIGADSLGKGMVGTAFLLTPPTLLQAVGDGMRANWIGVIVQLALYTSLIFATLGATSARRRWAIWTASLAMVPAATLGTYDPTYHAPPEIIPGTLSLAFWLLGLPLMTFQKGNAYRAGMVLLALAFVTNVAFGVACFIGSHPAIIDISIIGAAPGLLVAATKLFQEARRPISTIH